MTNPMVQIIMCYPCKDDADKRATYYNRKQLAAGVVLKEFNQISSKAREATHGPFSAAANPAEDWSDWKKSFTIYERATKYHKEDDDTRIALLLHVGGAELVQKYHAFTFPAAQQKFADVLQRFDEHFERYRNTTHASYVFHNLKQSKDQTFEAFAQAVGKQADQCAFGEARNRMITDRLVHGINDNSLRERLLREKKLTLDKVKDQCMAAQLSRTYAQEMQPQSPEVFAIHRRGPPTSRQYDATREPSEGAPTHRQPPQPRHNSQRTCSRCGQFHQPRQRPAFGQQCYNCGKPNHYAALCQQLHQPRPLQSRHAHVVRELQEDAPLSLDVLTVRTVQHSSSWNQRVNVCGHDIVFKLDTGSDVNLISTEQFQKLPDPPPLNSPGACVTTYTGEPLPLRGECFLRCSVPGTSATLKFCIVDMSTAAILGLDACRELKLIQLNRLKCNSVDGTTGRDDTPEVCFLKQSSSMALPSKPKETQSLTAHSCQDLSQLASEDQPSNRVMSSAESLRQITLQLNGLMNDTNAALNGDIAALADSSGTPRNDALLRRNQELATSLESLQQDRDQLEFQLQKQRGKLTRQQREYEREQQEREDQARRELGAINDQLQVHIQTIGILVAEKTELQSALSQSQQTAKQKAVEMEELQGRLKAAREKNTDLERKLNSVSSQSQVQEKSSQEYLSEIERLKTEQYKSSKSIEELKQELSELINKLGKKAKDNEALQQELGDVKKELQLEELHQEKLDMEKKVNKFKDAMEQIAAQKQQMSSHYQSYVDRLSQQLETSKETVEAHTAETATT
ncbi:golgin subfamily A member 2-like [Ixodes scapularis]